MKILRKTVLLVLLALVAQVQLVAAEPAYTEAQARAYAKEVLPLVEKAAGRRFKTTPPLKLSNSESVVPVIPRYLSPQFYVLFPELTNDQIRRAEKESSGPFAVRILGIYDVPSKGVTVFPLNLPARMALANVDPKLYPQIAEIVIAHELAHALQDQAAGLGRDSERGNAYTTKAVIEGQATLIMGKVANALGYSAAMNEFLRCLKVGWSKSSDPAVEILLQPARRLFSYSYINGSDFLMKQEKQGGPDLVWNILKNPPASMAMVFGEKPYSSKASDVPDYRFALKGIESKLGAGKSMVRSFPIEEAVLRAVIETLGDDKRNIVRDNLRGTHAVLKSGRKERSSVTLFVAKSAAASAALESVLDELNRRNINAAEKSESAKLTAKTVAAFPGVKDGKAKKISFTSESTAVTIVRAVRGAAIVQVSLQGTKLSDKQIAGILNEVFSRLAR